MAISKDLRLVLGIETSCDETSVAVYKNKKGLLSHVIYSQVHHKNLGGVMPELASRTQLEKIIPVTKLALDQAQVTLDDVNVIAVTNKPGLPGSLLVGVCFAKALAYAKSKQLIGINHLEGHAFSSFLEHQVPFPHLCITASGGHTSLYLITGFGEYTILGSTLDDAAGEAFDKIARILGFPYPGGPYIEKMAGTVDFQDFFGYPRNNPKTLDFSFSGLKTAVLYDLIAKNAYDMQEKKLVTSDELLKKQVASSLLVSIADTFEQKLSFAYKQHPEIQAITFVGGVACNKYIRHRLETWSRKNNLSFFVPAPAFCTDNGAMIAFVGNYKAEQGHYSALDLDILR